MRKKEGDGQRKYGGNIYRNIAAPLGNEGDHAATEFVTRLAPQGFPMHIAIHKVSVKNEGDGVHYAPLHSHQDQDEVNVLISDQSLSYDFTLGDELHEVAAPASVWIPAGLPHSANAIVGEGYFICIRIDKQKA